MLGKPHSHAELPPRHAHISGVAHGGTTDQNAIVCSSLSGRRVLENYFEQMSRKTGLGAPGVGLEIIPFGLDGRRLERLDRGQSRERLNLLPDEVVGLCFGRFLRV